MGAIMKYAKAIPENFELHILLNKIKITESGCWEWTGFVDRDGYGQVYHRGQDFRVHRVFFSLLKEPLLTSNAVDHICRNRKCSNPDHLRQVPPSINSKENTLVGRIKAGAPSLAQGRKPKYLVNGKPACKRGHIVDESNSYNWIGSLGKRYMRCKTCYNNKKYRSN